MDLELQDKVTLVTGAATGLGRAIAEVLAAEGAKVGVDYRTRPEAAQAVVDTIRAAGGTALAVRADLTCDEEVGAMFDARAGVRPRRGAGQQRRFLPHRAHG